MQARPVGPLRSGRCVGLAENLPSAASLSTAFAILMGALLITTWQWRWVEKARKNEAWNATARCRPSPSSNCGAPRNNSRPATSRPDPKPRSRRARNPDHPVAGPPLLSFFAHRDLAVPVTDPIRPSGVINWLRHSHDGRRIVSPYEGIAQVWDLATGQKGPPPPCLTPPGCATLNSAPTTMDCDGVRRSNRLESGRRAPANRCPSAAP